MIEWYRRLADVPGVSYTGSSDVDRDRLDGHDAEPVVAHRWESEGDTHEAIEWRWPGGSSYGSPVNDHALDYGGTYTPDELLRNLHERLELPGKLDDYQFALQTCASALWQQRRAHPQAIEEMERIHWLAIELAEAHPEHFTHAISEERGTYFTAGPSYAALISLYEAQGYIAEAMAVQERGERFGINDYHRERLETKLVALKAECE